MAEGFDWNCLNGGGFWCFWSGFLQGIFFIVYQRVTVCTERVQRGRGILLPEDNTLEEPLLLDGGLLLTRILRFAYTIRP